MIDLGLARLSDGLVLGAVAVYALAMLFYAADLALRPEPSRRSAEGPAGAGPAGAAGRAAVVTTVLGWGLHVAAVVTRGFAVGRVPWGNMYEFSLAVALVAVTAFLVLLARGSRVRYLGTFVMLPVVLYLGLASLVLYADPGPLVPALDSYWIKIHVVAAIAATGVFLVSGVLAILYLLRDSWERRVGGASFGPGAMAAAEGRRGGVVRHLPSAAVLDLTTYRLVAFAFPVWTFAVIAGAIWAEAAWGRYWGWDPKETWSFITWVVYAAYLHARSTAGWKGRRAGWFAVAAFATLVINYYVINIWVTGLHSYAGIN